MHTKEIVKEMSVVRSSEIARRWNRSVVLITPGCNESVDITEAEVREERTREP